MLNKYLFFPLLSANDHSKKNSRNYYKWNFNISCLNFILIVIIFLKTGFSTLLVIFSISTLIKFSFNSVWTAQEFPWRISYLEIFLIDITNRQILHNFWFIIYISEHFCMTNFCQISCKFWKSMRLVSKIHFSLRDIFAKKTFREFFQLR